MRKIYNSLAVLLLCVISITAWAQQTVKGSVKDSKGGPFPGVTVFEKGTFNGAATDPDGNFTLDCKSKDPVLVFSAMGYGSQEVKYEGKDFAVTMVDDQQLLKEVVITTGSRATSRTQTNTPLPIDNLTAKELQTSGQVNFQEALQYKVPSFNSVNVAVQDATSLLDPYEIRNLGPSRTLLLINGKRKNMSSLVYIQNTTGKGETGADLAAIPTGAIKRIEILRDGASAQYGSDAIAGVMNVILKDRVDYSELTLQGGMYTKGDGGMYGINLNTGTNLGSKGFINFNIGTRQQDKTNRSGKLDVDAENSTLSDDTPESLILVNKYLTKYPDGNNINGIPATTSATFGVNGGIDLDDHSQVYFNGAIAKKRVLSSANFRTPYWKKDYGLLHTASTDGENYTDDTTNLYKGYIGYVPTFDGDLTDGNATIGYRTETASGFKIDVSGTTGMNKQLYLVENTVNHSLGANSPTSFRPGGYSFDHNVANLDISKSIGKTLNVGVGAEFRNENFEIIAGDAASTTGEGSNSFPGIAEARAGKFRRFNSGMYLDVAWDVTPKFLIGATVRGENYSDFGPATVYKVSSRYLISDAFTVRGSFSTGFKAPSLHQINLDVTQATFSGGTIVLEGIVPNTSPVLRQLGVGKLTAEKATNYTLGIGANPAKNISITLDYYNISIKDRIVLSSRINGQSFFINGINTNTSGVDLVASIRRIPVGDNYLGFNIAANYNTSVMVGTPNTPKEILATNPTATIFNATEQAYALTSRPQFKAVVGIDFSAGKFNASLNNTVMGPATFRNADLPAVATGKPLPYLQFNTAVLTDIVLAYNFNKNVSVSLAGLNILGMIPSFKLNNLPAFPLARDANGNPLKDANGNTYEDTTKKPITEAGVRNDVTFNGRYWQSGYDSSHFSINGTNIVAQLSYKF